MRTASRENQGRAGRPADKQNAVLSRLRAQIVKGLLEPGSRLPARTELGRLLNVSHVTIQRAIDALRADGFVRATPRGTYVSANPPHLCRYAMTFPSKPAVGRPWSRFWSAIHQSAMGLQAEPARHFGFYHDVDEKANSADYLRLIADARLHRLAGVIFTGPPYAFAGTELLSQPDMPRVGIMAVPYKGIPCVYPDIQSFLGRAMKYLAARGRRRVAFLRMYTNADDVVTVISAAARHGLKVPPHWVQGCSLDNMYAAAQIIRLLMHGDDALYGLVICDDNLLEHASAGLVAAGVAVGRDLEVVAHCNYPCQASDVLPVKRLGFDCGRLVRRCIEIIDAQRCGRHEPDVSLIPAQFEDELAP